MKTIKREFHGDRVPVDFHEYEGCTFVECDIVYHGYTPPKFADCSWRNCKFTLTGPAANGLALVSLLKNSGNPGMVDTANKILANARLL